MINKMHISLLKIKDSMKDETTAALEPTAVTYTHLFYTCLRAGNRLLAMARCRKALFFFLVLVVSPSFFSECPSSTPQLRKSLDRPGDLRGDSPHERVPELTNLLLTPTFFLHICGCMQTCFHTWNKCVWHHVEMRLTLAMNVLCTACKHV